MSATISLLPPPPTDPAVPAARLSLKAPGTPVACWTARGGPAPATCCVNCPI
ncbi:hypothetical protein HEP87_57820 [Streptomyces sp. S1D4-11]